MDSAFGDFIAFSSNGNNEQQNEKNKLQQKIKKFDADGDSLSDDDDVGEDASFQAPKIIIKSISSTRRPYVASTNPEGNEDVEMQNDVDDEVSNDDDDDDDDYDNQDNEEQQQPMMKKKQQQQKSSHSQQKKETAEYTEQFRDVTCDVFRSPDAPVHAMFHLTQSITVRGPCAVIGLCGQCLVQGYLLRQRSMIIPDFGSNNSNNNNENNTNNGGGGGGVHVAVQPIPVSCRKVVLNELVKSWGGNFNNNNTSSISSASSSSSGSVAILQNLSMGVPINRNDPSIQEDLETIAEIESRFGKINWSWTRQVLESWKQRFGRSSDLTVVLVIAESHLHQHITIAPQDQQASQNKSGRNNNNNNNTSSSDFTRLPFFAPRMAAVPHNKLLHSLLPELITSPSRKFLQEHKTSSESDMTKNQKFIFPPSVLIAGSVSTGKSTTARYLCNLFISLYGGCLWLDLDLGQSEFAPPGGIGLYKVTEPLISSNQYRGVENILSHYLGTTSMRDPVATAKAIENICNKALELNRGQQQQQQEMSGSRRQRQSDAVVDDDDDNAENKLPQQQIKRLPIVINTHGWVLSTGRRATIEVLQRLCPSQVVHLFAPTCADKDWLLPSGGAINDPSCGLNSKVFQESKFSSHNNNITKTNFPTAITKKWTFTIHRYIHERSFEKDASDNRAKAWTRYFWNSQAPLNENRSTASSLMLSSLSMAHVLEKTEKVELLGNINRDNNSNNNNQKKISLPTEIHSRPGKIISIPFDKVRLVFAEEEQIPWQFRGRISKLVEPSASSSNAKHKTQKFSITSLTPAIKAELLDSISGALVGLGTTMTITTTNNNNNNNNVMKSPPPTSLEISQLSCESTPPNIFGYGIILCSPDSDTAANNFSSVKVVVPCDVAEVVEKEILLSATSNNNNTNKMMMINLVIGWQQYDANWNQDMANVALRG